MPPLLAQLRTFRRTLHRTLLAERVGQTVALACGAVLVLVAADYALRLPGWFRVVELALLGLAAAAWAWWRVLPALRFHPPLVEVALRLERAHPDAEGTLASATEFAQRSSASDAPGAETIRVAAALMPALATRRVNGAAARTALGGALAAIALSAAAALLWPELARIGARRMFTPLAGATWPARTMVEPAMEARVHARGAALALRAVAVRGDPTTMRVTAEYRLVRGGAGEWKSTLMAAQPDGSFERLIETDADAVEVVFRTPDMETTALRVDLVQPPRVVAAHLRALPPAYAVEELDTREADLGTGTDRRAVLSPPVLEGAQLELALTLADAVNPPESGAARAAFIERVVRLAGVRGGAVRDPTTSAEDAEAPGDAPPIVELRETAPSEWTLRWTASGPGVLELALEGRHGIPPASRIAFEIPSAPDQAPTIAVTEPASDDTVTDTAAPLVVAEGRDDLRATRAWLEVVRAARRNEPARMLATVEGTPGPAVRVETTLALRDHGLQPGDSVVLTAYATDALERNGQPRPPSASTPRVLRIIGVAELTEQVRSRLGQMREAAGRLREEQRGIREAAERAAAATERDGQAATEAERAQLAGAEGRLTDRVGAFERALNELGGRLERNGTDGGGLKESIDEAVRQAREAAREAQEAASALPQPDGAEKGAAHAASAERALGELEAALERDRVSAQFARRIDALAERVAAAQVATRALEQRTVGRRAEDLSAQERAAAEQAAQMQREAAAEARALGDQLSAAAREAESGPRPEPGAAEAMRQAAREAEERGLARQLEQGAQETQQNRTQAAQEAQQRAQEALSAMRQAMRDQQRARNEDLRRRIASMVESLRSLLDGTVAQVGALQRATPEDTAAQEQSARAVLGLARNAVSIAQEAVAAGQRLARVADLVERAGTQLDAGATSLRAAPPRLPDARDRVEEARRSVQDALAAAQAVERRAEREAENRRRAELRDLYTQLLERQRSAKASTEGVLPALGQPLPRRAVVEARRIAVEQNSVTAELQAIATRQDVRGSELFTTAQEDLVGSSRQAGADLSTGAVSRRTVLLQDQVVRGLGALVEALADPERPEDPFERAPDQQQQGQGNGGQGGAAQVERMPPIAELKLLRTLTQQALDDTRSAAGLAPEERGAFLDRITRRQRNLLELGEKWMERMKRANEEGGGQRPPAEAPGTPPVPGLTPPTEPAKPAAPPVPPVPPVPKSPPESPESPASKTPPAPPAHPARPAPKSPPAPPSDDPSLDEALGLEGPKERGDDAANRRRELERGLRQEKPRDVLASALNDLRRSTDLLNDQEPGLPTQRLQESAIRKFDELIATARRMQQEQSSSSNSQQQQQQQQRQQETGQEQSGQQDPQAGKETQDRQRQQQAGQRNPSPSDSNEAGAPDQGKVDPTDQMAQFDESRVAWGQLPPRVREAMRQGIRDPMSAAYRKLTQDYYRRLAEEARR